MEEFKQDAAPQERGAEQEKDGLPVNSRMPAEYQAEMVAMRIYRTMLSVEYCAEAVLTPAYEGKDPHGEWQAVADALRKAAQALQGILDDLGVEVPDRPNSPAPKPTTPTNTPF